jgi:hypothetical protein
MGLSQAQQKRWKAVGLRLFNNFGVISDEIYTTPGDATGVGDPPAGASYPARVAWRDLVKSRVNNQDVQPGRILAMILQDELEVAPEVDGKLTVNEKDYLVESAGQDAAFVTWTIQGKLL